MSNLKGYSGALIPVSILIGLVGVEISSAATKLTAVGMLMVIGVIQLITHDYARYKTN